MVIYSVPSSSSRTGVFKLLSSRANLHLSYNPAGRSHCRLQNHHGYIKHHYSGIGGASFSNPYITSPTSQFILQPFRRFTYVTAHSTTVPLLHLRHRHFTYFTWRTAHAQGDEKSLWWTSLLQLVTKFRSSYSFGQLLRILLGAVNLFSFSHIVNSDLSLNIHNALYFVKYPSRAAG